MAFTGKDLHQKKALKIVKVLLRKIWTCLGKSYHFFRPMSSNFQIIQLSPSEFKLRI